MRKVILHYHLFKNAGTSVDEMLKANFGERWVTREFAAGHALNQAQVAEWIRNEPDAVAFSSHTALLPVPRAPGLTVFPVIFVRHPIDRIASAYSFERRQGGDGFGAVLARNTTLAGYIEVRLSLPHDRQCRNFHCARLAQMYGAGTGSEVERALRAVAELPFVGCVEAFEASLDRLEQWLAPHFNGLQKRIVARNVSRDPQVPLAQRIERVAAELGPDTYGRLVQANAQDMALHEAVARAYSPVAADSNAS